MYSVAKIAKMLTVNRETVRRWINTGKLNAIKRQNGNTSGQTIYVVEEKALREFLDLNPKYQERMHGSALSLRNYETDNLKCVLSELRRHVNEILVLIDSINI